VLSNDYYNHKLSSLSHHLSSPYNNKMKKKKVEVKVKKKNILMVYEKLCEVIF